MILRSDGRLIRDDELRERREGARAEARSKKDAGGRVCTGCRSFRERYRLQGNTRVCRNAGAHDEVEFQGGEAGERRRGGRG